MPDRNRVSADVNQKLRNANMDDPRQREQVLQSRQRLLQKAGSKSEAIRRLAAAGWERVEIAKFLGIRYQHVRTVLITPLTSRGESVQHTS